MTLPERTNPSAGEVPRQVAAALAIGLQQLDAADAQALLLHALGRDPHERAWLYAHGTDALDTSAAQRYAQLVERRRRGEPLAYILGQRGFFGLTLAVDARVLDPRPDTETLVEWALDCLDAPRAGVPRSPPRVLDLGTGSGAVGLAIAHARPDAHVTLVDVSPAALAVAEANATRLCLPVELRLGSWFEPLGDARFDLIVSNPPYIAEDDPHLDALGHEPRLALVAGADGLDALRHIIEAAPRYLHEGGYLLLEHGWDQAAAVRALLTARAFDAVTSRRDLAGHNRCSGARWRMVTNKLRQ